MKYNISYSDAHPNAQKLLNDEFFFSVTDQNAPFGNDDSWETFMAFRQWLPDHKRRSKIDFIHGQLTYWNYPEFDLQSTDFTILEQYIKSHDLGLMFMTGTDQVIIATTFGQLYLEGFIDLNLRSLCIIALKRQLLPEMIEFYEEHKELRKQRILMLLNILQPTH